jgi:hypothetical protein
VVSIAELLDWKPEQLGAVADALISRRKKLVDLQDEIYAAEPPTTWMSGSASEARQAHEKLRLRLNDMAAEVSDVAVNLDDAQTRITVAKRNLEDALSEARTKGFTVNHATGRVTDPRTYELGAGPGPGGPAAERARNAELVRGIASDIDSALKQAGDADLDLQHALHGAELGKVEGGEGSLVDAVAQTPTRMDEMTPEQLAELLGDDVAIHTISAFLEAEAEFATWEIEGKAQADYKIMADGTVKMALHLEAGLGREIEVGGAEADIGGGATTDLELSFGSVAEAQAFLDGLDDRALDLGWSDAANVPAAVARNVAQYVMEQDISSFRTGVYVSGEMEFDQPWARGAVEGRAEAYREWAKGEEGYGLKIQASAGAELGGKDSGYNAAASLSGEVQIHDNGDFKKLTLSGQMSGTAANEKLGLNLPPGSSTGQGVDVELTVDEDNPALADIKSAMADGDLGRAKDLALDNGELVVRQTTIAEIASEEYEIDLKVAEAEVKYGASAETANHIWYREAGNSTVVSVDPSKLPVNN